MATGVHIVKKGDTLSEIAQHYGKKLADLVKINNIADPDKIVVGQKIKLTASSSSSSTKSSSSKKKATVTAFGIQSNTESTVYATWTWSKSNTETYKVKWCYYTGDGVSFIGAETETKNKQFTFSAPDNAVYVSFYVKPISKKHKVNGKETSYWTADWSTKVVYHFDLNAPKVPSAPTVTIDKYKLTAELSNLDVNGKEIEFQIVKDDKTVFKTGKATIVTTSASYSCTVDAGSEYKVRCRSCRDKKYSDWSDYSSNVGTVPSAPSSITKINASSETSVYLEWASVKSAKSYDVQYTTEKRYFDGPDNTTTVSNIEVTHYEKTGLETGDEYFFRVRAVNDAGASPWTKIKAVKIGEPPAAPTTWSSTTTVITGEPLKLYWVHNSADGSSQTYAQLKVKIGGLEETHTIQNSTDEDEKDKTSVYTIDTSEFLEGTKIEWQVRTAGVTLKYGDWSILRTVDVYAPPTVELGMSNSDGDPIDTLIAFPFYISALAGPNTQAPIGYHLTIVANEAYETVDQIGNVKMINAGDEVYSKYFDIDIPLEVELTPGSIDLENNISYTVTCLASMNSGLTAESSLDFTVSWTDEEYFPNAEISIDDDVLSAHIRPYCEHYPWIFYEVIHDATAGTYTATSNVLDDVEGDSVDDAFTDTGEIVYKTAEGVYFYMIESDEPVLVEDITLAVYRREYDGTFTEIATGLNNTSNTYVTDPHPALDYARYRVVATSNSTGAVSYYDVPGYIVGEKAVIIQWADEWSNFETTSEDVLEAPAWSGSMLKLPYNIDISDKNSLDVSLIEYIGRKHPVSYYGTQVGESSSWNVVIPKEDKETLYALRRLRMWMDDVYVREPSGSGYWANISVTFSQKHLDLTIPVSLEVTRVEGGI